jgi:hypothetical protein
MERGYIKVWRKLEDSGLLQMPNTLALFIYILMHAMHKDRKVGTSTGVINLKRGQYISGRKALAADLEQSEREIRTSLQRLIDLEIITVETTNRYSVYTIENYNKYQDSDQHNDQQTTGTEANKRPANDQQTTTNKELKNLRNKKPMSEYSDEFLRFWAAYPNCKRKGGRPDAYKTWLKLDLDAKIELILPHIAETVAPREDQFIAEPSAYLNKQGWDGWEPSAPKKRELSL